MAHTYTRKFRVRHYECDALGHLNNVNYVRYMQETAFDASTAAGFDGAAYEELGCYWLIRETDIEYLKPSQYGDTLEIKTWVIDVHRVRSRRAYEIRNHENNELVANASTDWVFLERDSNRPVRIPDEFRSAFFPDDAPDAFPKREKFPPLPPQPYPI